MKITLKDGSVKEYEHSMSVIDIAKDLSEGLARVATSGRVNGELVDLRTVVDSDSEVEILTFDNEEGKGAFFHTTSHIMAQAIKRLYPETKLAIGPSIENGFYYDLDREKPFVAEDLEKIEKEMKKIVKEDLEDINVKKWIELIKKHRDIKKLDKETLNELISKIYVHEKEVVNGEITQTIDIYYNFIGNTDTLQVFYNL